MRKQGFMLTGQNKVSMAQLRGYIQSGNVPVDTMLSARKVEKREHEQNKKQIGPELVVVVRTGAKLQQVLDNNPFQKGYEISPVFFVLFAKTPTARRPRSYLLKSSSMKNSLLLKTRPTCISQAPLAETGALITFSKRNSRFQ
jgi:uncharacterized protein (DUF1697 family)